mmetsp:Transcript_3306/g.9496  ORF Transcript_3306/g.9496 Transcript_3306/m.9496 type:complete len:179 (-) Transcript_3306:1980-2516(-)
MLMGNEQSSQSRGASRASSEAEGTVTTSNKKRRKAKRPRKSTHPAGGDADDAEVDGEVHHPPVTMEASANTFDAPKPGTGKSANKAARAAATPSQPKDAVDQVMITAALTDVRKKISHQSEGDWPRPLRRGSEMHASADQGMVRDQIHPEEQGWQDRCAEAGDCHFAGSPASQYHSAD